MENIKTNIAIIIIMYISLLFLTVFLFSRQVKILKHIDELEKQIQILEVYTDNRSDNQTILESETNNYKVEFGYFVGLNVYGEMGYHVILIDGKSHETIGNENYIFVMNERVVVITINDVLYSTPLREG